MKKLLIVEDEKLIRQGIRVIIEDSPLPVEQIMESKNGEQAWELIQQEEFDAILTDIKMPKMDGITLVKKISELKKKPHVVVFSGYDDFSYAVEMMRGGVMDYILKPVDRNKMLEILTKIDLLLTEDRKKRLEHRTALALTLRCYFAVNDCVSDEAENACDAFDMYWGDGGYHVICARPGILSEDNELMIRNMQGGDIVIATPVFTPPEEWISGVSDIYTGGNSLRHAYLQSVNRRKKTFFHTASHLPQTSGPVIEWNRANMEKYSHQINRPDIIQDMLFQCAAWAFKQSAYDEFEYFARCVVRKIKEISGDHGTVSTKLDDMYRQDDIRGYLALLNRHIERISQVNEQDSANRQKMREAVRFIHENYDKPLNMAVVSNHVSMNYTLFSNTFKCYTGVNFVTYLKELRIEKVKHLLRTTDKRMKEISKIVGYEDDKRMLKVFKQTCGISPKEYKMCVMNYSYLEHTRLLEMGYSLVFNDEFDYEGAPDPAKWRFETSNRQWANQELQAYTDHPDNVWVKDGKLVMLARKEKSGEREYTSVRMNSQVSWTHGRIVVSAKLPKGAGSWPAIWMLPDDLRSRLVPWPLCGEIDIMEHVGRSEDELLFSLHSKRHNHNIGTQYTALATVKGVCERFHAYAIEWTPTDIEFFVDDISYAKFSINDDPHDTGVESWPFNKPFFLIINIAVGGLLGGPVDESTLPYIMELDYVRVYQKNQ